MKSNSGIIFRIEENKLGEASATRRKPEKPGEK